jgi:hypothetical protein
MPRIICRYDVCVFNKKSRCTADEIEYDPDQGCLTAQTRDECAGIVDEDEELDDELEPDEDTDEAEDSDETLDDEFEDDDEFDDEDDTDLDDEADDEDDLSSLGTRRRV